MVAPLPESHLWDLTALRLMFSIVKTLRRKGRVKPVRREEVCRAQDC